MLALGAWTWMCTFDPWWWIAVWPWCLVDGSEGPEMLHWLKWSIGGLKILHKNTRPTCFIHCIRPILTYFPLPLVFGKWRSIPPKPWPMDTAMPQHFYFFYIYIKFSPEILLHWSTNEIVKHLYLINYYLITFLYFIWCLYMINNHTCIFINKFETL